MTGPAHTAVSLPTRPWAGVRPFLRRTRAAAGGGGIIPSDIAGLNLWLKADGTLWQDSARTVSASADGDPVGAADDGSGNGSHYTQATAGNRPTLKTNVVNGKPVLRFDGSNDKLAGPNHVSGLTAGTCFIVVKLDADPPPSDPQTGLWMYGIDVFDDVFPYTDANIYDGWGSNGRKSTGNPAPSLASWRVYSVVSAAGEWTSRIDGAQHYTTGTNTVGFTSGPLLGVGVSGTRFLDGDVAEFIVYDSALGTTDRQGVEQYLSAKYGLGF